MTAMLASVADVHEVRIAVEEGVDVIDLKDPRAGILGALTLDAIRRITRTLAGTRAVSATVGDLPMEPQSVRQAVDAVAACGVDYVKLGLPAAGDWRGCIRECARSAHRQTKLVGVLFADQAPALEALSALAENRFWGAMLDTADKDAGSLRAHWGDAQLASFVRHCRQLGLRCGLAGSLRVDDIEPLLALAPDYLGFRGALCTHHRRISELNREHVRAVRRRIPVRTEHSETALLG